LTHHHLKFSSQESKHGFDARLTEARESPEIRSSDSNGRSAERKCLKNICAPSKATVDDDRQSPADSFGDFREALDC
jgi:hypothetical protein